MSYFYPSCHLVVNYFWNKRGYILQSINRKKKQKNSNIIYVYYKR